MEIQNFSLSQVCDKTENIFVYFFTKLKTYYLSYFISIELADQWKSTQRLRNPMRWSVDWHSKSYQNSENDLIS